MRLYEYQFGICVGAETEEEAQNKIADLMDTLTAVDAEGDPSVEGPWDRTEDAVWKETLAYVNSETEQ